MGGEHGHAQASLAGGAPHVRHKHDVRQCEERGSDVGFVFKNVEAGAGNCFLPEGRDERLFIHHFPPRGVDEKTRGLHAAEFRRANQVMRLGRERNVQAQEIRFTEQPFAVHVFGGKLFFNGLGDSVPRVIKNPHRKPAPASRHRLPDVSEAVKAERLSVDVRAVEELELPAVPASLADVAVPFYHAPRHRQQERKRQVSGGFLKRAGGARHRDAARRQGGEVEVVVPHAGVRQGAELWRVLEHLRGDARARHQQPFNILDRSQQLFFRHRPVFREHAHLRARGVDPYAQPGLRPCPVRR